LTILEDETYRAEVLGVMAASCPAWVHAQSEAVRSVLTRLLRDNALQDRSTFIKRITQLQPVWLPLSPSGTTWEVAQAIIEICWRWDWQ